MIDTGTSHALATPLAARELGIQVRRHEQDPHRRKTRLGRDVQIHVDVESSDTGSKTGWEYAVVGGEFLAEYVLPSRIRSASSSWPTVRPDREAVLGWAANAEPRGGPPRARWT